jgi:hypothetical protein
MARDTAYHNFVRDMAQRLEMNHAEADALVGAITRDRMEQAPKSDDASPDHLELLLAVSLNANLRNASDDARFNRLKFLLRNDSTRAVSLATRWIENEISFEEMLAAV